MTREEQKKALTEERKACEEKMETLLRRHYAAGPGEGTAVQREMSALERKIFAIDYLFLIRENADLGLSADTKAFLETLACFAKDKPLDTIRVQDYIAQDTRGIKELINEARDKHVLELRMRENTEFTGYILRNDFANKHQVVHGDLDELKEIMRSPIEGSGSG